MYLPSGLFLDVTAISTNVTLFSVINFNFFHLIRKTQHLMRAELLDQADTQRRAITNGTATTSCIPVILHGGTREKLLPGF